MPKQGDIVLIPVPFTDLSSTKRRPVIVISRNEYNLSSSDVLVVAMTSNLAAAPYSFIFQPTDLMAGSLKIRAEFASIKSIRCPKVSSSRRLVM
jgi:mRNA interferase MazF